jgi:hypothetical protein
MELGAISRQPVITLAPTQEIIGILYEATSSKDKEDLACVSLRSELSE